MWIGLGLRSAGGSPVSAPHAKTHAGCKVGGRAAARSAPRRTARRPRGRPSPFAGTARIVRRARSSLRPRPRSNWTATFTGPAAIPRRCRRMHHLQPERGADEERGAAPNASRRRAANALPECGRMTPVYGRTASSTRSGSRRRTCARTARRRQRTDCPCDHQNPGQPAGGKGSRHAPILAHIHARREGGRASGEGVENRRSNRWTARPPNRRSASFPNRSAAPSVPIGGADRPATAIATQRRDTS